jgi:hypothetical protein
MTSLKHRTCSASAEGGFHPAHDRGRAAAEHGALFHQGERESMYLADIARRVILVVLFDNRTTLGLVKLRVRAAVEELNQVFSDMFGRPRTDAPQVETGFLGDAEDEIDKLFGA